MSFAALVYSRRVRFWLSTLLVTYEFSPGILERPWAVPPSWLTFC